VKRHSETNGDRPCSVVQQTAVTAAEKVNRSERSGNYMYHVNFVHVVHSTCVFPASVERWMCPSRTSTVWFL